MYDKAPGSLLAARSARDVRETGELRERAARVNIELACKRATVYARCDARERRALTPCKAARAMDPKLTDPKLTIQIVSDVV